jgi:formamidopyrimidine-DNA glycosylase
MPELPEVEVLAQHLRPLLHGKIIRSVAIRRAKVLHPTPPEKFRRALIGAKFKGLIRRGKYLLFKLHSPTPPKTITLLGHLGMTGRMYVARRGAPLPKHTAVVLQLNRGVFVYEDQRYFGRLTLDLASAEKLGPEPLGEDFSLETFKRKLKSSRQPIKVKLLDQSLVAGIGNIYASEALFRAGVSPRRPAGKLSGAELKKLQAAIRDVLTEAIACGSTIPLNFGAGQTDGLFYFGGAGAASAYYTERLQVYDRAGNPCVCCGTTIRRIVQAARSTFFCPRCQKQ